jgi:hypothetical protein
VKPARPQYQREPTLREELFGSTAMDEGTVTLLTCFYTAVDEETEEESCKDFCWSILRKPFMTILVHSIPCKSRRH